VSTSKTNLDGYAYSLLTPLTSDSLTKIVIWITFFGSRRFLFPSYVFLVAYYLFIRKKKKLAFDIAVIGLLGNQLLSLIQYIIRRHRPLDPLIQNVTGYSFPSGHSFAAYTFFGLLTYIMWQTQFKKVYKIILSVIFFLIASLIAITRVYLHVHYASDVIGGFCLSIMWLILSLWLLHKADKHFYKRK
jgi:undecaprenyl-diphosphatase